MKLSYIKTADKYQVTCLIDNELVTGIVSPETIEELIKLKEIGTTYEEVVKLITPLEYKNVLRKKDQERLFTVWLEKIKNTEDQDFEFVNNKVCYKGIPISIPEVLLKKISTALDEDEYKSLVAFWRNLSLCPEPRVRESLFAYLENNGFYITNNGLIVSFRRVWASKKEEFKPTENDEFAAFVTEKYFARKKAKKGVNSIYVGQSQTGEYFLTTSNEGLGSLGDLYNGLKEGTTSIQTTIYEAQNKAKTQYTLDGVPYNETVKYQLLKETRIDRKDADHDPDRTCSEGLHLGSPEYVKHNSWLGDTIMVCLSNPMDAVSVPNDGYCKFRSVAVYPVAIISDEQLDEMNQGDYATFDFDYLNYTLEYIENKIQTMQFEELKEHLIIPRELNFENVGSIREALQKVVDNQFIDMSI